MQRQNLIMLRQAFFASRPLLASLPGVQGGIKGTIATHTAAATSGPPSSSAEYIIAGVDQVINWARKGSLW